MKVTKEITAQNTWSDELVLSAGEKFEVRSKGGTSCTVTIQAVDIENSNNFSTATDVYTLKSDLADGEIWQSYPVSIPLRVRAGIATGDYGSGTVTVTVAKDRGE